MVYANLRKRPDNVQPFVLFRKISNGKYYWYPPNYADQPDFTDIEPLPGPGTNLFLNPVMANASASRLTRTNNAINPSAENLLPLTATQRTNIATNPRATAYSGGNLFPGNGRWFGSAPAAGTYSIVSGASDGPVIDDFGNQIATYARKTWTTPPAAMGNSGDTGFNFGSGGVNAVAVTTGQVITFSAFMRPSVTRNNYIAIYQYDAAGAAFSTPRQQGSLFLSPAGQWTRVSVKYIVPAGVSFVNIIPDSNASTAGGAVNWVTGSTLDMTGVCYEFSNNLIPYYDGAQGLRNDGYTISWTGTQDASTSILRGTGSSGWSQIGTGTTHTRYSGESHTGSNSYRIDTAGNQSDGVAYTINKATVIGDVTSVGIWVKAAAGLPLFAVARLTTNTPTTDKIVNFTATGDWQFIKVENFVAAAASPLWQVMIRQATTTGGINTILVDDAIMEFGPTVGESFSGDTVGADFVTAWTGAANLSTSTYSLRVPDNLTTNTGQGLFSVDSSSGTRVGIFTITNSAWGLNVTGFTPTLGKVYTFYWDITPSWTGKMRIRNGHDPATEVQVTGLVKGQRTVVKMLLDTPAVNANIGLVGRSGDGFNTNGTDALTIHRVLITEGEYNGPFYSGVAEPWPDVPRYPR